MAQDVLAGRHALVTGGAQGLGAGMAKALAEAGAQVMIGDVQDADRDRGGDRRPSRRTSTSPTRRAGRPPSPRPSSSSAGSTSSSTTPASRSPRLIVDAEAGDIAQDARGQRARHGARHQARAARDAPRRRGRQRRRDRQHRVGRGDDRVPGHRRLLGDQVGGRPAHPGRRLRGRQARLRRARQLRLSRASCPTAMGKQLAVDMAELGLFEQPEAAVGAVDRADARWAGSARSPTWPTRSSSWPPTRRGSSRASGCPSTAAWACERHDEVLAASTTWTRARRSAATRRASSRATGRSPTARCRT